MRPNLLNNIRIQPTRLIQHRQRTIPTITHHQHIPIILRIQRSRRQRQYMPSVPMSNRPRRVPTITSLRILCTITTRRLHIRSNIRRYNIASRQHTSQPLRTTVTTNRNIRIPILNNVISNPITIRHCFTELLRPTRSTQRPILLTIQRPIQRRQLTTCHPSNNILRSNRLNHTINT